MAEITNVTTGEARFSFVHVFAPHTNDPTQEAKYSITLLIPKSDTATKAKIDAAIAAATQRGLAVQWAGKMPAIVYNPVYDGDGVRPNGERFGPECAGCWVFTASSKANKTPRVVDTNLNDIIDQSAVYSGCYGRVNVDFYPYSNPARKGIGCGLNHVQKLRDGESLGAQRISAEDAFGGFTPMPAGVDEFGLPFN